MKGFKDRIKKINPKVARYAEEYDKLIKLNDKFMSENSKALLENQYYIKKIDKMKNIKKIENIKEILKSRTLYNITKIHKDYKELNKSTTVELLGYKHNLESDEVQMIVKNEEYSEYLELFRLYDISNGTSHYKHFTGEATKLEEMKRNISIRHNVQIGLIDDEYYKILSSVEQKIKEDNALFLNVNYIESLIVYVETGELPANGSPDELDAEDAEYFKVHLDIRDYIKKEDMIFENLPISKISPDEKYKGIRKNLFAYLIKSALGLGYSEETLDAIKNEMILYKLKFIEKKNDRHLFVEYYKFLKRKESLIFEMESKIVAVEGKDNPIDTFKKNVSNRGITISDSAKGAFYIGVASILSMIFLPIPFLGVIMAILFMIFSYNFNNIFDMEKRLAGFEPERDTFTKFYILTDSIKKQVYMLIPFSLLFSVLSFNYILSVILLIIVFLIASYIHYVKRKQINYMIDIEKKLAFSISKEVWTPENSTDPSDKNKIHYALGTVNGNPNDIYYFRAGDLSTHTINLGGTGSGKSALAVLPLIIQFILSKDTGSIIIDPKGDLVQEVYSYCLAYQDADLFLKANYYKDNFEKIKELRLKLKDKNSPTYEKDFYDAYLISSETAELNFPEYKPIMFFDPLTPDCPYINLVEGDIHYARGVFIDFVMAYLKTKGSTGSDYFVVSNIRALQALIVSIKFVESLIEEPGDSENVINVIREVSEEYPNGVYFADVARLRQDEKMTQMIRWLNVIMKEGRHKMSADVKDMVIEAYTSLQLLGPDSIDNLKRDSTTALNEVSSKLTSTHLRFALSPTEEEMAYREELNVGDIVRRKGIMLVTTRQDALSEEDAGFLGMGLIYKIQKTIFEIPLAERQQCQLVIDEFQVFANQNMKKLFNQGRSYKVCIHAATQSLDSITDVDLRDVIFANTFFRILHQGFDAKDRVRYQSMFGSEEVIEIERNMARVDKITGLETGESQSVRKEKKNKEFIKDEDLMYSDGKGYATVQGRFDLINRVPVRVKLEFSDAWTSNMSAKRYEYYKKEYVKYIASITSGGNVSSNNDIIIPETRFVKVLERNQNLLTKKSTIADKY